MPSGNTGDGTGWDVASPQATDVVADAYKEIYDLRKGVALRLGKEHVDPATASVGGEHLQGSAKIYVVANAAALPTTRPDGVALSSDDAGRLALTLDDMVLHVWDGNSWETMSALAGSISPESYVLLESRATGTFTGGAWVDRYLTCILDAGGVTSFTPDPSGAGTPSPTFTLDAGTYRCRISCPAFAVNSHQARLILDVLGTPVYLYGTSEYASASDVAQTRSEIEYRFTLASASVLKLQHACQTTKATNGLGVGGVGFTTPANIFVRAEFWKEN